MGALVQVSEKKARTVASVADLLALPIKARLMLASDTDVKACTHRGFGAYLSGLVSAPQAQIEALHAHLASVAPSAIVDGQRMTLDTTKWLQGASNGVAYAVALWCESRVNKAGNPIPAMVARGATLRAALLARGFEFPEAQQGEAQQGEASKASPAKAKPSKGEAQQGEAQQGEAQQGEASKAKPSKAKPSKAKPSKAKPSKAKPSKAKPSKAKPSKAKPSKARKPSKANN